MDYIYEIPVEYSDVSELKDLVMKSIREYPSRWNIKYLALRMGADVHYALDEYCERVVHIAVMPAKRVTFCGLPVYIDKTITREVCLGSDIDYWNNKGAELIPLGRKEYMRKNDLFDEYNRLLIDYTDLLKRYKSKTTLFYNNVKCYEEERLREIEDNYRELSKNILVKIIKLFKGIKESVGERPKPPRDIDE